LKLDASDSYRYIYSRVKPEHISITLKVSAFLQQFYWWQCH